MVDVVGAPHVSGVVVGRGAQGAGEFDRSDAVCPAVVVDQLEEGALISVRSPQRGVRLVRRPGEGSQGEREDCDERCDASQEASHDDRHPRSQKIRTLVQPLAMG